MKTLIHSLAAAAILSTLSAFAAETAEATALEVAGLSFELPASWEISDKVSPMVKATIYSTPEGEEMSEIETKFYHFGQGQGGSIDANVTRWEGQFQEKPSATTDTIDLKGAKITIVTIEGTYLSGPPMMPAHAKKPIAGQAMLGAIIENEAGTIFVKSVGAKASIDASREGFIAAVSSPFEAASEE